jgi:1-acyl-sn-glycerol-3-phosphate acyltransferase
MHEWLANVWYDSVYLTTFLVGTLGLSLRTEGAANIPRTGPVLLLANHQSLLDPVLVGLAARRHLHYLARDTLYKNPLVAALIRSLNAVPIHREGAGKEGLQIILRLLQEGHAVVVFPEGTRTRDGNMSPFKPGFALLVSRAKPTIIPVGIAGAFHAWPHGRPLPKLAPLFLPPSRATLAVSVGAPLSGQHYAAQPRQQMLQELFDKVQAQARRAEQLRRKS